MLTLKHSIVHMWPDKTPTKPASIQHKPKVSITLSAMFIVAQSTGAADLVTFDHALHALVDVLRQSGVGAYPLPAPDAGPPSEQQLITDTTSSVQQLYEEFKRMQESSAVVANLLAAPESVGRPKV